MMSNVALWTAAHYKIPMLIVVCQQPLVLQRRAAPGARRAHPLAAAGEPLDRPAHLAAGHRHRRRSRRSQGAQGFGPVTKQDDLVETFRKAIAAVEAGEVAVVDVRVEPGYSAVATAAMLRGTEGAEEVTAARRIVTVRCDALRPMWERSRVRPFLRAAGVANTRARLPRFARRRPSRQGEG